MNQSVDTFTIPEETLSYLTMLQFINDRLKISALNIPPAWLLSTRLIRSKDLQEIEKILSSELFINGRENLLKLIVQLSEFVKQMEQPKASSGLTWDTSPLLKPQSKQRPTSLSELAGAMNRVENSHDTSTSAKTSSMEMWTVIQNLDTGSAK